MTINHLTLRCTQHNFPRMLAWYTKVLSPLGYELKIRAREDWVGMGPRDGFPHFWLQAHASPTEKSSPTHIAFDADTRAGVESFHRIGLEEGGTDHGKPGIRTEMSWTPYFAAFLLDPEQNIIEAVCIGKEREIGEKSQGLARLYNEE